MSAKFATVRSLIYWEYAKLIAGRAAGDRKAYQFVNFTYQRLQTRRLNPSTILVENQLLFQTGETCAYCGSRNEPEWEHIVPRALNGPESFDNMVCACRACNASKGASDPYQWHANLGKTDEIPRLVLGKLLKVVFSEYERKGLLDDEAFMHTNNITRTTLTRIFARTP